MHEYELAEIAQPGNPAVNPKKRKAVQTSLDLEMQTKTKMLAAPTERLNHLKVTECGNYPSTDWAAKTSYNGLIDEHSRIVCYVCGGSGHFLEECGYYQNVTNKFG